MEECPVSPVNRVRSSSFADIDEVQASGILTDLLRENDVFLGGCSIGKGFKTAARRYLHQAQAEAKQLAKHPDLEIDATPLEEAFYVVDLGVVVSQVYQWRKYFPRVEPFYALKCNPDPVILQTLAILGCNFDCASKEEIKLVQKMTSDLPVSPEILYANPCKSRNHMVYAVMNGVRMVTVDNVQEIQKCASISKKIQIIIRIVTDDRGSQCRLSSKFGAPKARWPNLLKAAKQHGLQVVGVSFHVGSGCRDASRYKLALQDCRELFDMAEKEGFDMSILDIGGGFPGETHSLWNPVVLDVVEEDEEDEEDENEGKANADEEKAGENTPYMFFIDIAQAVAPMIDNLFPSSVRVIAEPGRYFVAAAATLVTSVVGARSNEIDEKAFHPEAVIDSEASQQIMDLSREEENQIVHKRYKSFETSDEVVLNTISEELSDYAKYYAKQNLVTQETDAYNDALDLYKEDFDTAADLLGIPDQYQKHRRVHTVEGMSKALAFDDGEQGLISLAAAGEAAVNGMVLQAVADSAPLQDDFAYYVNDGVYGAFNNIMFDHATVRPRVLRLSKHDIHKGESSGSDDENHGDHLLYASTVFGPTCDSIDVIARSVLLPKLKIGDWIYFQNMGAYTMAAASSFNGFNPSDRMYVCSVQPEYFESLIAGPGDDHCGDYYEEKKET
jgi:ornithine decarboxylase